MTQADRCPPGTLQSTPAQPPGGPAERPATYAGGTLQLSIGALSDGTTVELRLTGELDVSGADTLRRHIEDVIVEHDPHRLLLDLSGLTFADSSGLAAIVWAHKAMTARGRQLRLQHPQGRVLRVLHITGLHTRLHITESAPVGPRSAAGAHRRLAR